MVPPAATLGFGHDDIRHVAGRAGLDQRADHGAAERAGASGDDDMAVAKVHLRFANLSPSP